MVTPLGNDVETSWANLIAGESGADDIKGFDASEFPVHFACELKGFEPTQWMEHKQARRMDRFAQMIVAASRQAESDSAIDIAKEDDRPEVLRDEQVGIAIGVVVSSEQGTGALQLEFVEAHIGGDVREPLGTEVAQQMDARNPRILGAAYGGEIDPAIIVIIEGGDAPAFCPVKRW